MAKCAYCGSTILFSKKRIGHLLFCDDKCLQNGQAVQQVSDSTALEAAFRVRQGLCPVCKGAGPVDVHVAHTIWSALVLTSYKSTARISCRSCGTKAQTLAMFSSLVAGWWGIPWGLIMTPVQIVRNFSGLMSRVDADGPSPRLVQEVRLHLAAQAS